jgi:hypothetical protein
VAIEAICLTMPLRQRYRRIAEAMHIGIQACGDRSTIWDIDQGMPPPADVGVMYGWRRKELLEFYPRFVYADLAYWRREDYFKINCNGWSPDGYVRAGLHPERWERLGLDIHPARETPRKKVVIAGQSVKSSVGHGLRYMAWETKWAKKLQALGFEVVYRPKPRDTAKRPIPGVLYDNRPIMDWRDVHAVVTHHSNIALEAIVQGVPAYCETGAAKVMSFHPDEIQSASIPEGREQFLWDCAYLQWTLEEMRSGECWTHLKERGLV